MVERDQPFQNLLVREVRRPAVGGEHLPVEVLVDLLEHRDQGLLVDRALLVRERLARLQFLQHVVHAGNGEVGMQCLPFLAVPVELLAEIADSLLL
jgi:hypothetical protein